MRFQIVKNIHILNRPLHSIQVRADIKLLHVIILCNLHYHFYACAPQRLVLQLVLIQKSVLRRFSELKLPFLHIPKLK